MKRNYSGIWRPYMDSLPEEEARSCQKWRKKYISMDDEEICMINSVYKQIRSYPPHKRTFCKPTGNDGRSSSCGSTESVFKPILSDTSETSSMNSSYCSDAGSVSPTCYSPVDNFYQGKSDNGLDERRQRRTKFSDYQLGELNRVFVGQTYLNLQQRYELATRLHLSEVQVKNWFQNRRMKAKRDYIHAIEKGYVVPVKNPELPRFSRMPENYFLSYPFMSVKYR